jgi:hypothetical protein
MPVHNARMGTFHLMSGSVQYLGTCIKQAIGHIAYTVRQYICSRPIHTQVHSEFAILYEESLLSIHTLGARTKLHLSDENYVQLHLGIFVLLLSTYAIAWLSTPELLYGILCTCLGAKMQV